MMLKHEQESGEPVPAEWMTRLEDLLKKLTDLYERLKEKHEP